MIKRAALYPYCAELLPIVRHFDSLQSEYTLGALISPPGLGLIGKDAGYACNHPDTGLVVTDSFDMKLFDTLIVTKTFYQDSIDDAMLEQAIEATLQAGKEVVFTAERATDISKKISSMFEEYGGRISFSVSEHSFRANSITDIRYQDVDVPVILVGGLLERADVLETVLAITDKFKKMGFSPLTIIKHPVGNCFGLHGIHHILTKNESPPGDRVTQVNYTIRRLVRKSVPDIIVLEAPDALLKFNRLDPNGFGILSYMLCQAVKPDCLICCLPFDMVYDPLIEAYSNDFSYRFGSSITASCVSNVIVDSAELLQSHKISVTRVDHEKITIPNEVNSVYNILHDAKELAEYLAQVLSGQVRCNE